MPHSKSGKVLEVGDRVVIECTVKSICAGEEFCNITLESVEGRKPDGFKETITLNAAVIEKISE